MGNHARACAGASLAFWLGVLFILIRRRESLTRGDLAYIRWGLLPIGILGTSKRDPCCVATSRHAVSPFDDCGEPSRVRRSGISW